MNGNGLARREFLKESLAFLGLGAFGARRLFAAPPGWRPSGALRLSFGVIADTHYYLSLAGDRLADGTTDAWVLNALNCFKSRNVDAVMHCGDMAHRGIIKEMQLLADSWFSVFPNSKAPDGHEVVKLFVPGNHEIQGGTYDVDRLKKIYGNNYRQYLIATDLASNWKSVWKEDYAEAWHKTVKGYHFFGYNTWSKDAEFAGALDASEQALVGLVTAAGAAGELDGSKPFFLVSHIRPRSSVNTPLASYTNGLGFFGHIHKTCALWTDDEITWWEGGTFPRIQCPPLHFKGGASLPSTLSFAKAEGGLVEGGGRGVESAGGDVGFYQGFLVGVYDDAVVIERHDFGEGHGNAKIGPDWVMPIAAERYTNSNHPFSQKELRKADAELGAPQFTSYSSLPLELDVEKIRVAIPKADGNMNTRALIYNVEVVGADGEPSLWKSIYATGCDDGIGYERNGGVTVLEIPREELPAGERLTIRVYPVSPLGLEGSPLSNSLFVTDKVRVEITKSVPRVGSGRYVMTQGANLPNADNLEFVLPRWVRRAAVEDGEIVIYTTDAARGLRVTIR